MYSILLLKNTEDEDDGPERPSLHKTPEPMTGGTRRGVDTGERLGASSHTGEPCCSATARPRTPNPCEGAQDGGQTAEEPSPPQARDADREDAVGDSADGDVNRRERLRTADEGKCKRATEKQRGRTF